MNKIDNLKKWINHFLIYLKLVFSQLKNILALFPILIGINDFYSLGIPFLSHNFFNQIPTLYLYIFVFVIFFLSTFSAWRKLREKLENTVDYSIDHMNFDIQELVEDRREEASKFVEKSKSPNINILGIGSYKDYIEEMDKIFEKYDDKTLINFCIKNVGIEFDQNIQVEIKTPKNVKISSEFQNELIPNFPNNNQFIDNYTSNRNHQSDFRNVKSVYANYACIVLREMRAGGRWVNLFYRSLVIEGNFPVELKFKITSKKTKEPIVKKVIVKDK